MKNKNVFTFGVLIAVLIIQIYHNYFDIPIVYKIVIDFLILLGVPYLYIRFYNYITNICKKYVSSRNH